MRKLELRQKLEQKFRIIKQYVARVREEGPIVSALVTQELDFLAADIERLLHDTFFASGSRAISLLRFFYEYSSLSATNVASRIVPGFGHFGGQTSIGSEFVQMNLKAARRGVQIRYLFLVDDWLLFALDDEIFRVAQQFVLAGIDVRLAADRTQISNASTSDFMLYFAEGLLPWAVLTGNEDERHELLPIKLVMSQDKIETLRRTFDSIWESSVTTPLQII